MQDYLKQTALYHTVQYKDTPQEVVSLLISPQTINVQNHEGKTALHIAVGNSCWNHMFLQLENDADVNITYVYQDMAHCIAFNFLDCDFPVSLIQALPDDPVHIYYILLCLYMIMENNAIKHSQYWEWMQTLMLTIPMGYSVASVLRHSAKFNNYIEVDEITCYFDTH